MEIIQCFPKRRHIKFRCRGITQKKGYNTQNAAKVLNQECLKISSDKLNIVYLPCICHVVTTLLLKHSTNIWLTKVLLRVSATVRSHLEWATIFKVIYCDSNPINPELNPICYLLALLAHHFLHVSRIMVKSLTLRLLMSYIYIYGASILDVSRSHTTTQHSR